MKLSEAVDIILGIIAWGVIAFVVLLVVLKWIGIIQSPNIIEVLLGVILVEQIRIELKLAKLESKFELVWSEFKKQKKLK